MQIGTGGYPEAGCELVLEVINPISIPQINYLKADPKGFHVVII